MKMLNIIGLALSLAVSFLISFTSGEIKEIRNDPRSMILFKKFGFTHPGHAFISVSGVSVSSALSPPDPSRLGFFLLSDESLIQVLINLNQNPSLCVLDSHYIIRLFTFRDLSPPPHSSFNYSYPITLPAEYSLFFSNCHPQATVSMSVRTEIYNLDSSSEGDSAEARK